ncbi:hypothetical protein [Cellulomonas shaoxiangyii]|uniref:DUF4352 domain-containing protein n=1 Tax=Cellulomonas shaoxiangyii TaxID=2566013 RepID=A0A4P7SP38_9CELL|nr:hypothetical protein [Cellulomonas shaoxiangyii]QCB94433.1 hypothetical protein E5225_13585 [Cellulomonas shaoxiangyii]TGY85162.1 hypothetical protein E5226_07975 [Cellulomonas shaoxiangyii]
MSEGVSAAGPGPVRVRWWLAALALVVVAVVVAVALGRGPGGGAPGADGSRVPSAPSTGSAAGATGGTGDPSDAGAAAGPTGVAPASPASDAPAAQDPAEPDAVPTATVAVDAVAQLAEAVTARVSAWEAVTGEAVQPGEVGGPALRVTVEVVNGTPAALDLRGAVVNLYHGPQATPAVALTQPGGSPLPAGVEPGATATGTFVFAVPPADRDDVRVELDARAVGPVLVFTGSAPR